MLEEKEGQGELSVHPGLVKICAAFIVDPVLRVRGANVNAWAVQESWLTSISQTWPSINPFTLSAECAPECFVWIGK